jgi:hypothetical protein
MGLLIVLVAFLVVPAAAFGQGTGTPAPVATVAIPEPSATVRPTASLALSSASGLADGTITANGMAFRPGETR